MNVSVLSGPLSEVRYRYAYIPTSDALKIALAVKPSPSGSEQVIVSVSFSNVATLMSGMDVPFGWMADMEILYARPRAPLGATPTVMLRPGRRSNVNNV